MAEKCKVTCPPIEAVALYRLLQELHEVGIETGYPPDEEEIDQLAGIEAALAVSGVTRLGNLWKISAEAEEVNLEFEREDAELIAGHCHLILLTYEREPRMDDAESIALRGIHNRLVDASGSSHKKF